MGQGEGAERAGPAWVQGTFRVDEVEDLHEERTDLLEQWKKRHGG